MKNGSLALAAQRLSFEKKDTLELHREADAVKWAIDDVKKSNPKAELALLVLPPKQESKVHRSLERVINGLDGKVVREHRIDKWALETADRIAPRLHRH